MSRISVALLLSEQDINWMTDLLRQADIDTTRVTDVKQGLRAWQAAPADLVVCDLDELGDDAELIWQRMEQSPDTEWLLLSRGDPHPDWNAKAQQCVATVFRRPVDPELVQAFIDDTLMQQGQSCRASKPILTSQANQFGYLLGSSAPMRHLYRVLKRLGPTGANVLVVGESGVGKEHVAKTLHRLGCDPNAPFMAINCGALSPELIESELFGHVKGAFTGAHQDHAGIFHQAEGGTVFLDEITEMPQALQVKLLRVLESGEYRPVGSTHNQRANVRLVAATNRDPQQAIASSRLREDIYYRLAQFVVNVPPLREREGDIEALTTHFLAELNHQFHTQKGIDPQAIKRLNAHRWPGNVRELKHAIEHGYLLCAETILPDDLPQAVITPTNTSTAIMLPESLTLDALERLAITQTLTRCDGNKTRTAEVLGISPKTLYNKLNQYQSVSSSSTAGERIDSDRG
ncbi:sigma-54 dependent transcriptional regulator [Salinivibrio sp. IB872]|uniref:sigma-54 dependent transcriptional regulator n=1 Tax=Salinivibrio sp. IB872 TaxID=1766123 RepID=UPI0018E351A6|nr:sigma-54 dependent transcriptional regulator [Salinivibrio sp. IB872]